MAPVLNAKRAGTQCTGKATFFANVAGSDGTTILTECASLNRLRAAGSEIATHTWQHTSPATLSEITRAIDHFSQVCLIPRQELRGFRSPFLLYDDTTFGNLRQAGVTYDATMMDTMGTLNPNYAWY